MTFERAEDAERALRKKHCILGQTVQLEYYRNRDAIEPTTALSARLFNVNAGGRAVPSTPAQLNQAAHQPHHLYMRNIPFDYTYEEFVEKLNDQVGDIDRAHLGADKMGTKCNGGYAFVTFKDKTLEDGLVKDGYFNLDRSRIHVNWYEDKSAGVKQRY